MSAALSQIRDTLEAGGSYLLCETLPGAESAEAFEPVMNILADCESGVLASHFQPDSATGTVFLVVRIEPQAMEPIKSRLLESQLPRDIIFYFYGPRTAAQKDDREEPADTLAWRSQHKSNPKNEGGQDEEKKQRELL